MFDTVKAAKGLAILNNGGTTKLSMAQIVNMLINLPDAKKKLSSDEFEKVYALFKEYRQCKTKFEMDLDGYYDTAIRIITEFDDIAPYEKYSGGNEKEYQFLLEDIRGKNYKLVKEKKKELESLWNSFEMLDTTTKENKRILEESYSEEEIEEFIKTGKFTIKEAEDYRELKQTVIIAVESTSGMCESLLEGIDKLQKEIMELERD